MAEKLRGDHFEEWVQELISQCNTETYYIEYCNDFSNHIIHGIVALVVLGASRQRVQEFIDCYARNLEKPSEHAEQNKGEIGDWELTPGSRKGYYRHLTTYINALQNDTLEKLLRTELHKLYGGLACALFHPLIQMGYGVKVGDERIILEGLAYLRHSHYSVFDFTQVPHVTDVTRYGDGLRNVLDILDDVRQDKELSKAMNDELIDEPNWNKTEVGGAELKVLSIIRSCGEKLLHYTDQIKWPTWFDLHKINDGMIDDIALWIFDMACTIYCKSEIPNEFGFIHGITGAWSLRQLTSILNDTTLSLRLFRVYLFSLLALYMSRGSLLLSHQTKTYVTNEKSWEEMKEHTRKLVVDEHVYKIVQVCYDVWRVKPKDLYFQCAQIAVEHDIFYG